MNQTKTKFVGLNRVNEQLLMSALDPDRNDITVSSNRKYGDGMKTFEIREYFAKNNLGAEVFSLQRIELDHSFNMVLKIGTDVVSLDTTSAFNDTEHHFYDFVCTLERAMKQKIAIQNENKALEIAKKSMSAKDIQINSYLTNMLQR